jgi:uncharacterized protein YecE (DUF72 family)
MRIGTAAWSIPRDCAAAFPGTGKALERYARVLRCAEINTSFYRAHRPQTYVRWASETPAGFRFAVKLPRAITHDARLRRAREPLRRFLEETSGLGDKLGVLLVQLPGSFAFEPRPVRAFFSLLRTMTSVPVACEPRHPSWFEERAGRLLADLRITRVAADPARVPAAASPGGWLGPDGDGRDALVYWRWHGSPRPYWSRYEADWLRDRAQALRAWHAGTDHWCIFDNTASGAATANALALQEMVRG